MGKGNPRVNTTRAALFVETLICGSEWFLVSCGAQSERFIVRYAKEEQMNPSTTRRKPKQYGANFGRQTLSSVSQCNNFPLTKLCHVTDNEKNIFMALCLGSQSLHRRLSYWEAWNDIGLGLCLESLRETKAQKRINVAWNLKSTFRRIHRTFTCMPVKLDQNNVPHWKRK